MFRNVFPGMILVTSACVMKNPFLALGSPNLLRPMTTPLAFQKPHTAS